MQSLCYVLRPSRRVVVGQISTCTRALAHIYNRLRILYALDYEYPLRSTCKSWTIIRKVALNEIPSNASNLIPGSEIMNYICDMQYELHLTKWMKFNISMHY